MDLPNISLLLLLRITSENQGKYLCRKGTFSALPLPQPLIPNGGVNTSHSSQSRTDIELAFLIVEVSVY